MKFSVQTGQQNIEWGELSETWQRIEALGYDGAWTIDHFLPTGTRDTEGPCMDGWVVLAALAAETKRLRLGTLVTGNLFRNPALLAKTATTIDQISGGRVDFGIGAGNNPREHEAYGWDFPSARERLDRLDEALQVIRLLWSDEEEVSFEGEYYSLNQAPFRPAPVQRPHPPIMVGGAGERRTLNIVARHADAWNGVGNGRRPRAKGRGAAPALQRRGAALRGDQPHGRHAADPGRESTSVGRSAPPSVAASASRNSARKPWAAPPSRCATRFRATPTPATPS